MIGNEKSDTAQRVRALASTDGRHKYLAEGAHLGNRLL